MKAVSSRWLTIGALCFVGVGIGVYNAKRFANAALRQRTTTTQDISRRHYIFHGLRFDYYSCYYSFSVDGTSYRGDGDCPQHPGAAATVYYDSADPRLNSLLEFGTTSEREYQHSTPWAVVGALILLASAFFGVLGASEKPVKHGASMAGGTGTYPDQPESANSPELRNLYLEVVNQIHPDRASNEADRALRERLMKQANAAFKGGDAGTLREVLEEYRSMTSAT